MLYGPADATCHSLSVAPVNPDWFYQNGSVILVLAYPGCPGKEAVKRMQCSSCLYAWCMWYVKVADDLKTLQRQAAVRPAPAQYIPTVSSPYVPTTYVPTVSPTPFYPGQMHLSHAGRDWSCPTCTYENPAQRTCCEMCGKSARCTYAEQ